MGKEGDDGEGERRRVRGVSGAPAPSFAGGRAGEESKKALVILYKYPKTKEGMRGHSPPPRRQAAAGRGFL